MPPTPPADSAAEIPQDTPCRKCGYNLRGLNAGGQCPECGTLVGVSLSGDLLRFSDPSWLDTLARGVSLILVSTFVGLGAFISYVILGATRIPISQFLVGAVVLAGSVLGVVGAWFITMPDPSGIGEDRYGAARKVIRIMLAFGVAYTILNLMAMSATLSPIVRQVAQLCSSLAGIGDLIGTVAQLQYFEKLAARIPRESLIARARFLKTAIGISNGMIILFNIFNTLWARTFIHTAGRRNGIMGATMGLGCFVSIDLLASVVFLVMYLLMLVRFRRQFRGSAALARQTWSINDPIPPPR